MAKIQQFPKSAIQDYEFNVKSFAERQYTAWLQIDENAFVIIKNGDIYLSDENDELRQELSEGERFFYQEFVADLFEERYWQEIEQAEEEYREWHYTENQDNLRKSLKIA